MVESCAAMEGEKMLKLIEQEKPEPFDHFASAGKIPHYSKTHFYGDLCMKQGIEVQRVSARDEQDQIVATALIQWEKICGIEYGYICYGFNLDYTNSETLGFFAKELTRIARQRGAAYLRMELNVPRLEHEKDGQVKIGGFNNENVAAWMETCGYKHLGYTYGYSGNRMSRFTYCLNLDQPLEKIRRQIKHYASYQKKNIQRAVKVQLSDEQGLSILVEAERELAHKLHFLPKKAKDFRQLMECFPNQARLYVVSADVDQALTNLKKLRSELIKQRETLVNPQRLEENQKQITALDQEISELIHNYQGQGEIKLGAKLIIQQGEHVYNVNMYTKKILPNFRAAFALHSAVIEDCWQRGAKTYDFEGVSGALNPDDPYYGIHDFKKSFGGDFIEFLGEFDWIGDPKQYQKALQLQRWRRKLRRGAARLLYR